MNEERYLFGLSFTVGSNTGIALVVASSERQAFQLLKNSGRYNCSPDKYTLIQSRNLGLSSCLPYELLFEEYTNAKVVYDAFLKLADKFKREDDDKDDEKEDVIVEDAVEVTWSELKSLRDGSALKPGMNYIITDYVATTSSSFSRSANHPFDIIVTAVSDSALSEKAAARKHFGDQYFKDCNLSAWEISYCLDNDKNRFGWADPLNGKGVVYRLKDDCDNDLPYDFKSIQFRRYRAELGAEYKQYTSALDGLYFGTDSGSSASKYVSIPDSNDVKWYYTFSSENDGIITDDSLFSTTKPYSRRNVFLGRGYDGALNNNVFVGGKDPYNFCKSLSPDSLIENAAACTENNFSYKTYNNTVYGGECCFVDCDVNVRDNVFIGIVRHSRFGSNFRQNVIFAPKDISFIETSGSFEQNLFVAGGTVSSIHNMGPNSSNILKSGGNIGALYMEGSFIRNTFNVTSMTYNTLSNFEDNVVSIQSSFVNNEVTKRMKFCTVNKQFANNSFDGAQFQYITFNAPVINCHFSSIIDYAVIPEGTGNVAYVNFEGGMRGTSSAPISIDYAGMFLSSMSGIRRRMTVEGTADGALVASWKEGKKQKGAIKESGSSEWEEFSYN